MWRLNRRARRGQLELSEAGGLAGAAFLAGALNAAAGGGSFLTLPALMATGVLPVTANATGTVALLPGYLAAAWAGRHDLRMPAGLSLRTLLLLALAGGGTGAWLLTRTPDRRFADIAPWLLLAATTLFAIQPWMQRRLRDPAAVPRNVAAIVLVSVCAYGGYFNGGLGILLLAALAMLGLRELNAANALKNLISGVLTAIAVSIYAVNDAVQWLEALWMMAFATAGGYAGGHHARRLPPALLRGSVVAVGVLMATILLRA
jgi:uncharacterized membrane protein YfcA